VKHGAMGRDQKSTTITTKIGKTLKK